MPANTLEFLQSKLRQRHQRVRECDSMQLRFQLSQVWRFLHSEPTIRSVLTLLTQQQQNCVNLGGTDDPAVIRTAFQQRGHIQDEEQYAAFAYGLWQHLQLVDY